MQSPPHCPRKGIKLPWVLVTVSKLKPNYRAGGVAQGEGPEFKPQYCKKKKRKKEGNLATLSLQEPRHCSLSIIDDL
jgi:hypothetical protein